MAKYMGELYGTLAQANLGTPTGPGTLTVQPPDWVVYPEDLDSPAISPNPVIIPVNKGGVIAPTMLARTDIGIPNGWAYKCRANVPGLSSHEFYIKIDEDIVNIADAIIPPWAVGLAQASYEAKLDPDKLGLLEIHGNVLTLTGSNSVTLPTVLADGTPVAGPPGPPGPRSIMKIVGPDSRGMTRFYYTDEDGKNKISLVRGLLPNGQLPADTTKLLDDQIQDELNFRIGKLEPAWRPYDPNWNELNNTPESLGATGLLTARYYETAVETVVWITMLVTKTVTKKGVWKFALPSAADSAGSPIGFLVGQGTAASASYNSRPVFAQSIGGNNFVLVASNGDRLGEKGPGRDWIDGETLNVRVVYIPVGTPGAKNADSGL